MVRRRAAIVVGLTRPEKTGSSLYSRIGMIHMSTPRTLPWAVWINKPVGCGCEEKTVLAGCPRSDDLERPRRSGSPQSGVIRPIEQAMLLVAAH